MRTGFPETSVITQLGSSWREIRDTWGVSKEAMAGIVLESWLEWSLSEEWDRARRPPEADMLACLLYTSPSPRDGLLSRMPSSA